MAADRILDDVIVFIRADHIPDDLQRIFRMFSEAFKIIPVLLMATHDTKVMAEGCDRQRTHSHRYIHALQEQTYIEADNRNTERMLGNCHTFMMCLPESTLEFLREENIISVLI